jgi:putative transposase
MSRPLRVLFNNAWYHVMNRGAAHATIFYNNDDYQTFVNIFQQLHSRYRFEIHAYCLMPNHYHLLVRTPLPNLSEGMRHLNSQYTRFHNLKHKKDGALFRGRYKAILVDAENYLLRVSRYIHLNPVKAGLTSHPSKYRWSSYQFYARKIVPPDWFYTAEILSRFGTKQQKNKYSLFVVEKTDQELETFYRKAKLLPVLGSDIFRKQIDQTILTHMLPIREIPDQKNACFMPDLQKICRLVAEYYHVSPEILYMVSHKKGNLPRTIAIYLAAELSSLKFKTIADFFKNISVAGISQIIFRVNKLKNGIPAINNDLNKLCNLIKY